MFRLYWILLFMVTAVATHAGYVLFYPGQNFDARVAALLGDNSSNRFIILTPAQAQVLVPSSAPNDVVGLCRYDLNLGSVAIETRLPRGYWTFSVYSTTGKQSYMLTDVQAGETAFSIELSLAPDILRQVIGALDDSFADAEAISNAGWRVKVNEPKGLAIVWLPLADAIFRPQAEAVLGKSSCKRK